MARLFKERLHKECRRKGQGGLKLDIPKRDLLKEGRRGTPRRARPLRRSMSLTANLRPIITITAGGGVRETQSKTRTSRTSVSAKSMRYKTACTNIRRI